MTKAERKTAQQNAEEKRRIVASQSLWDVGLSIADSDAAFSLRETARDPEFGYTAATLRVCQSMAARFVRNREMDELQRTAFYKAVEFPETPRCPECKQDLS